LCVQEDLFLQLLAPSSRAYFTVITRAWNEPLPLERHRREMPSSAGSFSVNRGSNEASAIVRLKRSLATSVGT
jgi:hypothetical protein